MEPLTRRGPRTRVKKLRLLAILTVVATLGAVSFVFGMFMAVASDLPTLEDSNQYRDPRSSVLFDDQGHPIGVLSRRDQYLVTADQIPMIVKDAVISIEDKRFRTNDGIDLRAIGRAFVEDVLQQHAVQGASTIEEQFVKNALQAESHRTIFEKLREAALAYRLDHEWPKEKIITEYLNTIYFGNGAYGIEAAAQTYFPQDGCGTPENLCVSHLRPWQAALLAGVIQSPTDYDPLTHPAAARARRETVLEQMYEQGYLTRAQLRTSHAQPLPSAATIGAPQEGVVDGADVGYFDNWVEQQVIARYGANRAYDGGLQIRTTLNLGLQRAAEQAVASYLSNPAGPTASLVAIENSTGDVRAMVGGRDYEASPFNLATEGERQPGSAFKVFDLAAALEAGISPESVWPSRVKVFKVPHSHEVFVVHNDEGEYVGERTLTNALAFSDNTVFAEVGIKVGTKKIARIAREMGITTPVSTNYAMTIGGLKVGVSALDMAHAYETLAHSGQRVTGTMAAEPNAPVAIQHVKAPLGGVLPDGHHEDVNQTRLHRVLPAWVAQTETSMLETVVDYGTGTNAALGRFAAGKTGTTSDYADAWFVGWDSKYTVAVWVGYPEKLVSMTTDYNGGPVVGGSFPALIWHDFMVSAQDSEEQSSVATQSPAVTAAATGVGESDTLAPRPVQTRSRAETQATVQQPAGAGGAEAGSKGAAGTGQEAPSAAAVTPVPATPAPEQTREPSSPVTAESGGTSAPTGGTSAQGP